MVTLEQVAEALGRPSAELQELDRGRVALAFVPGSYETVVVRDRRSGETIEATLDAASGARVDAAELRRRDREHADRLGGTLEPALRDLLLRHADLPAVEVTVTRAGSPEPVRLRRSAAEVAALAQESDITRIGLAQEPEILDA